MEMHGGEQGRGRQDRGRQYSFGLPRWLALISALLAGTVLAGLLAACGAQPTRDAGAQANACNPTANPGSLASPPAGAIGVQRHVVGAGQPPCPPPAGSGVAWTPVASTSSADVLDAFQNSPEFVPPTRAFDFPAGSTYRFDTPVLVLPATTGSAAHAQSLDLPYFIICGVVNGVRCSVTYMVEYNPSAHQLRISGFSEQPPNNPAYGKPFPWDGVSATAAVQTLAAQRGIALRAGTVPQLVDFVLDPRAAPPNPSISWSGGGYDEALPIWRLVGTDGRLYFVGIDGRVYDAQQLPIAPDATLVRP